MGLEKNTAKFIYVNISKGKLVVKINDEKVIYDSITATITNIEFGLEEYNSKQFEVMRVTLQDIDETYLLKMRTDSGYFRGFVNSLKTADISLPIVFIPSSKEDNGKTKTTFFLRQNNNTLKHAFTKDNMGELPPAEKILVNGMEQWDNTKQLSYWKSWLMGMNWQIINESQNKKSKINSISSQNDHDEVMSASDDLPF
jgi:hypothetical protein